MDFVKRNPILTAVLAICVAAFAVESFFLVRFNSAVTVAQRNLQTSDSNAKSAVSQQPAPTAENKAAAQKNVADLNDDLQHIVSTLQDTPKKIPAAPSNGADLLAAINGYVVKYDDLATQKGITLPSPKFTFGMAQYFGPVAAPPADKINAVFTQLSVLDYVMDIMMNKAKDENQKMIMVSVQREDVTAPASATTTVSASTDTDDAKNELFRVDPLVSARGPGVNTYPFKIRFIGYTDALRILLSELANFEMPLVVRSVEVEPATPDILSAFSTPGSTTSGGDTTTRTLSTMGSGNAAAAAAAANANRKPVVAENLSQFTLIIEYIELPSTKPADAAAPADASAPAAASPAGSTPATATSPAAEPAKATSP